MFTIRPFEKTEQEYRALAEVLVAVWPEYPDTAEEFKHSDETRDSRYLFQRLVAEMDGRMVGCAVYSEPAWSYRPGKYYWVVDVLPDFRRQGIGSAMYTHIMDALAKRDPAPVLLTSSSREDQEEAVRFLEKRDFQVVQREPCSCLNVEKFDFAKYVHIPPQVEADGIVIRSLAELAEQDPHWKRKFWELDWELMQDVPTTDDFTQVPFKVFDEKYLGAPKFSAEAQFIALDGGQWVGMSGFTLAVADPTKLYTALTGVVRSHRRRKIATALKLRGVEFARDYGATLVETDNDENNPMFQLNLALGFEPQPAWLQFEKKLADFPAEAGEN